MVCYVVLGGAVPNPHLGLVYEGIELCKKENVDFLLAVGGGSAIDSAKAIGYGVGGEMGSAKVLNEESMLAIFRASV